MVDEKKVIIKCFYEGYPYNSILLFLKNYGIQMCIRTLKTKIKSYGLSRKPEVSRNLYSQVVSAIQTEIQGPGSMSGYRAMWHTLRMKYHLNVNRSVVMNALRETDPDASEERKGRRLKRRSYVSAGPNDCWHIDGYDKLKPYGFPVHACIDGYSRRIIWVQVLTSNNDPIIIAKLYLQHINELGGCPKRVRSDCGTENVILAAMQCYLRKEGADRYAGKNAHIYGTSPSNQRQEAWWSYYRRHRSNWIINFFKEMVDNGETNPSDFLEKSCLQFCFAELIQEDLDEVKAHWNTHRIRKSGYGSVPGRPNELFCFPPGDKSDQLCDYSSTLYDEIEEYVDDADNDQTDNLEVEYFKYLASQINLRRVRDWDVAHRLYLNLINLAR